MNESKPGRHGGRIFRRGETWWIAYFRDGTEFRESTRSKLNPWRKQADDPKNAEAAALRFLDYRLKETHQPVFVAPRDQKITIHELLDSYSRDLKLRGRLSVGTKSLIKIVGAHFGEWRATAVTSDAISQYVERQLAEGYRPASINRRMEILSAAFRLAIRERRLTECPYIRSLSEVGNARQGFTSRRVLDQVIENLPQYLRDVTLFAFLSSWRKGEILTLEWANVHADAIRLRAENSKERESRSLALDGELAEVIERRGKVANGPLVFQKDGKPVGDFRKSWATACKLAGIPGLLFHDLRRSGVRDLIRAGVSPHVAMSISGHKTDSMLRRYAVISESDQRAALRRTEEFRKAEAAPVVTTAVQ